jgi:Holliday junction resolvase RusA-like endonuclease
VYKVEIEVSGQPQGKGRPRFTRTGKAYTPDKTREYESRIQAAAWKAMQEAKLEPTERFVSVEIIAFMEIPKSWSKVKRIEAEYGALQHTTKPDLDNIIKAALDGISSGKIIMDDKQVTSIKARKMYCHPDRGAVLYMSVSWTNPGE